MNDFRGQKLEPGDLIAHSDSYRGYLSLAIVIEIREAGNNGKGSVRVADIKGKTKDPVLDRYILHEKLGSFRAESRLILLEKNAVNLAEYNLY